MGRPPPSLFPICQGGPHNIPYQIVPDHTKPNHTHYHHTILGWTIHHTPTHPTLFLTTTKQSRPRLTKATILGSTEESTPLHFWGIDPPYILSSFPSRAGPLMSSVLFHCFLPLPGQIFFLFVWMKISGKKVALWNVNSAYLDVGLSRVGGEVLHHCSL